MVSRHFCGTHLCLVWLYPHITLVAERNVVATNKFWFQMVWTGRSNGVDGTTCVQQMMIHAVLRNLADICSLQSLIPH